jgi:hypothetical protein
VLTVPTNKYPVPYALAMAYRRGISDAFMAVSSTEAHEQYGNVERDMRRLERQGKLRIVDPKEVLCPADQCLLRGPDGTPLYRDRHHLSLSGAEFVSGIVGTCFAEAVL